MHKAHTKVLEALRPDGSPRVFAGALSEEKALAQVTELLGEVVVFGVRATRHASAHGALNPTLDVKGFTETYQKVQ